MINVKIVKNVEGQKNLPHKLPWARYKQDCIGFEGFQSKVWWWEDQPSFLDWQCIPSQISCQWANNLTQKGQYAKNWIKSHKLLTGCSIKTCPRWNLTPEKSRLRSEYRSLACKLVQLPDKSYMYAKIHHSEELQSIDNVDPVSMLCSFGR